jgi:hypothetical protein
MEHGKVVWRRVLIDISIYRLKDKPYGAWRGSLGEEYYQTFPSLD